MNHIFYQTSSFYDVPRNIRLTAKLYEVFLHFTKNPWCGIPVRNKFLFMHDRSGADGKEGVPAFTTILQEDCKSGLPGDPQALPFYREI